MPAVAEGVRARASRGSRRSGRRAVTARRASSNAVRMKVRTCSRTGARVDAVGRDAVQQAAGLLGALGRVLGQVAGDLAALLTGGELADVEHLAPAHAAAAELVRRPARRRRRRRRARPARAARRRSAAAAGAARARGTWTSRDPAGSSTCRCTRPRCWYSATFTYAGRTCALEPLLRHPGRARERAREVDRGVAPERRRACCSTPPRPRSPSSPGTAAHPGTGRPRRGPRRTTAAGRAGRPARRGAAGSAAAARPGRAAACARARSSAPSASRTPPGARAIDVRDALAAPQAGADQVVGVLAVALRARRADGLAAVPARLAQHAVGFGRRSTTRADGRARRRSRSCPRRRTGRAQ